MPQSKATSAELDDYRVTSPVEVLDLLRRVQDANSLITLSGPNGSSFTTLLWSIDTARQIICFSGEDGDAGLQALLESDEVEAVAYLDSIKIQFDLYGLVQVHGGAHNALNAQYPKELYRFQRRSAFRVRPLSSNGPVAQFNHPAIKIGQCHLSLDDDTQLDVGLMIHHITAINPETRGTRLGCEITGLNWGDRSLQSYINQTQKRQLALTQRP